ncbi:MAG TPA: LLM class flavin-dependent oxidoreductase [Thermomicrobiaceae bacterium]|nr:LLM class flavin-dependent oxidoreductase [Thermomicrobiaceae bacterium]
MKTGETIPSNYAPRFGIGTGNRRPFAELARQWQQIEEFGFDTAWVVDHLLAGPDEKIPYYEAWTLITALGVLTHRLRFGIMVSSNTFRNPGLLAKEALTIDHATNGRVELGIGTGWMEREHEAYSYPFPTPGDRVGMLEEALQIIRGLMTQELTTFHGRYYDFVNAPFEPKPLQQPHIPIVVGASGPRMLEVTARYADNWNTRADPERAAPLVAQLMAACRRVGRDPAEIRLSVYTWHHPFTTADHLREVVASYRRIGITDFIFPMPPDDEISAMERLARDVLPELRRA